MQAAAGCGGWAGYEVVPVLLPDLLISISVSSHAVMGATPTSLRKPLNYSFVALPLLVPGSEGCSDFNPQSTVCATPGA